MFKNQWIVHIQICRQANAAVPERNPNIKTVLKPGLCLAPY